jgi:hypothetical protein
VKLKIAENLSLPTEIVTQTVAVLAKRRAGKSYLMRRLVEQLVTAAQQVVLVDPKGDQWGVRSAADGKAPGLPLVILGGERGDVPLEAGSGEVVAKLVVEERVSVVLDLSLFRKHEVATFMTGFLENLYRLKAKEIYRTPLMLVIDEADAVAPQKPQKGEERMLGAAEDIVRRGGQRGIGCVLVSQRSAVLNKNVLTQAQVLIALRTIAPQDLAAMNAWIDVHGTEEQKRTLMESLPSLPVGDAWIWSPGWPTVDGIFKRVHVLPIETFDSGATPKPGETRREPKTVADVDLDALKRQMSATIEKAKAEDPRELKKLNAEKDKRIRELQAQLEKGAHIMHAKVQTPKAVEKFVLKDGQLARAEKLTDRITREAERLTQHREAVDAHFAAMVERLSESAKAIDAAISLTCAPQPHVPQPAARPDARPLTPSKAMGGSRPVPPARPAREVPASNGNGHDGITKAEQRVLDAVAWWHAANIPEPTRLQVAMVARYTVNGHFNNLVGGLRTKGFVDYPMSGGVTLTESGDAAANRPVGDLTRDELIQRTLAVLKTASLQKIFRAVVDNGADLTREDLATKTGYTVNGHFNNMVGSLRSLGVIDYPRQGGVRLGEMFEALA